jgi:hypothetical protein
LREIRFSQTHRSTGARRRFVISQSDVADASPYRPHAWRYVVQLGDGTPWTAFRTLDIKAGASDEDIQQQAIRDFNGFTRGQSRA